MIPVDAKARGKVHIETGTKSLHLWDMVELCSDCVSYCKERTKHIMDDTGFEKAGGWFGSEMTKQAQGRRDYETKRCETGCFEVKRICPSSQRLRADYENPTKKEAATKGPEGAKPHWKDGDEVKDPEMKKHLEILEMEKTKDGKFYADKTTANRHTRAILGMNRYKNQYEDEVIWAERPYENADDMEGIDAAANRKRNAEAIAAVTLQRCESAAGEFSKLLFAIRDKPAAIKFEKMKNPGNLWANKDILDERTDELLVKQSADDVGGGKDFQIKKMLEEKGVSMDPEVIERQNAWRRSVADGLEFDETLEAKQKEEGTYEPKVKGTVPDSFKY